MSSIIGQAVETGASGGSGAGGSFGSILGSLGSSVGSLFSGGGFQSPVSSIPSVDNPGVPNTGVPAIAAAGDPGASIGAVGSPSGMTVGTPDAFGGGSAGVAPVSGIGGAAPGSTFTPAPAAPPQTPDPSLLQELEAFFNPQGGSAAAGGGGAGGKGMGLGGWINMGGSLLSALNKYLVQRTLQNPAQLAAAANKLAIPMGAQARNRILAPVRAEAMETSGVNAPLLYSQALASALAPYQYQNEQRALQEEIAALTAAESPVFTSPSLFGGTASATG